MGEKDITERTLESYNDVFADIVNVLLFDGKRIICENELEEGSAHSQYKADGKIHEQERDVAKCWKNGNVRIAFYGLENQAEADIDMPLRVISYDSAAYRAQLLADIYTDEGSVKKKSRKPRYPVVTLILYFGYKRRWNKPVTLLECLEIPKDLEPFVSDYSINIFEIAWLPDEKVDMFKSDFRIVADYFVQMRKNKNYIPSPDTIIHVHETLQLLSVLTKDRRFEEAYNNSRKEGRELNTMGGFLEDAYMKGLEHGIEHGAKRMSGLVGILLKDNRLKDLERITEDSVYCAQLLDELVPENAEH